MKKSNWETVIDYTCLLGEGPVWDAANSRILWVDILYGHIHAFHTQRREYRMFQTGQMVGAIAVKKNGLLTAALKSGFYEIDMDRREIKLLKQVEADLPDNRFNDGKCDPTGRFWAGTMSVKGTAGAGKLYMLEHDNQVSVRIDNVSCSNGMAWNKDHDRLYYIDTPTQQVVAYDYNPADGSISNGKTIITIPEEEGYPDGMTIDEEGMLWIALWNGGKVVRYDPETGRQLMHFSLPAAKITSCAFGGEHLSDLYITSAKVDLSEDELKEQPLAGSLFVIKNCGYRGMPSFLVT
ncbi:MAG TPA: SMP-30/gluconolactonase/LRE family protein [Flavitalea sp.]|nr:SMP-30/gluconolactonase/LRE family protein [Flavitalea sp.]